MVTTYESYCRERKARIDKERALGRSRATADIVEDLLELKSSDEDNPRNGRARNASNKQPRMRSEWSLSSNSIVSASLSVSTDEDADDANLVQKSIQSYTSQLFSPLYVVKKEEHNIFQENRKPLPRPGQTPKYANLCYKVVDKSDDDQNSPAKDPRSDARPKQLGARRKSLIPPPTRGKLSGIAAKRSLSSSHETPDDCSKAKNLVGGSVSDRKTSSTTIPPMTTRYHPPTTRHDGYARKSDWSLRSFASTDSGQLSLEPLAHSIRPDTLTDQRDTVSINDESTSQERESANSSDGGSEDSSICRMMEAMRLNDEDDTEHDDLTTPAADSDSASFTMDTRHDNNTPSESLATFCGGNESECSGSGPLVSNMIEGTKPECKVDTPPDGIFNEMVLQGITALRDTILTSNYPLSPLFTRAKLPFQAFRDSMLLQAEESIRNEVNHIRSKSPLSLMTYFGDVQVSCRGLPSPIQFDQPRQIDSLDLDPGFLCMRMRCGQEEDKCYSPSRFLALENEQTKLPSLLIDEGETGRRMDELPSLPIDECETGHPLDDTNADDTLPDPADNMLEESTMVPSIHVTETEEPLTSLDEDEDEANVLKDIILDCSSKDRLATGKKFASRLSPTFSYDSHLASLGSYDDVFGDGSCMAKSNRYQSTFAKLSFQTNLMSEMKRYTADELFGENEIVFIPQILSASESERHSDDSNSILRDIHLRAVMEATAHGDNASRIFPTFSSDSLYMASCESDDGLCSELDALETIGDDLRQEIEAAHSVSFLWTSPTGSTPRPKGSFDSTMANFCVIQGVSSSLSAEANAVVVRRKVHFNEQVQEYVFASDVREEHGPGAEKDDTVLDDVIGVFEDLLDELSFACVSISRAMDRTRSCKTIRSSSVW
jgi:hypothetical protein